MLRKKMRSFFWLFLLVASLGGCGAGDVTLTPTKTLTAISVTPANSAIAKNTSQQFIATGIYSDNTTQDLTASVTWSSSDATTAAVDVPGHVIGKKVGRSIIKASYGSHSDDAVLNITDATLVSIAVTPANPSIALGTKQQFTATGTYSDNSTQNLTNAVTWSSSSTGVATISNAAGSNGLAASVAAGTTTITAAAGNVSGSTSLTVTAATLTSIAVTPASPSIANRTTQQFKATGTYSDGSIHDLTDTATWSSSSVGVATISNAAGSKGLATAVAAGSTTITSVSGSVSGSTTLTVTASAAVVTLSWDAPIANEDGSPVTLSGYKIYYGTSSGGYTKSVSVASTGTTPVTYTLSLSPGTYYFAVTAVSIDGQESAYSNETSKTL